jgi:hypothetical protein
MIDKPQQNRLDYGAAIRAPIVAIAPMMDWTD